MVIVQCSAPNTLDFTQEIHHLTDLVGWRTDYFHFAWWRSVIAIPLFVSMFWVFLNWRKHKEA